MTVLLKKQDDLPEYVTGLPKNYNFEIGKTLRTIKHLNARKITLQFPDGLLAYAPLIIDTIERYTAATCTILDDVVYGACCVDDRTLYSDLLIHYGHSCLVPVQEMDIRVLYVFVEIRIDVEHLHQLINKNFTEPVAIIGTIQFNTSVNKLKRLVNLQNKGCDCENKSALKATVPQVKPLSPGEVLGCTSPVINNAKDVIYIGDGRFHLESAMIQNPSLNFYKYCPFTRKLTQEFYEYDVMIKQRKSQIAQLLRAKSIGVILGSLGRQGNRKIMENVIEKLKGMGKTEIYRIIVDEINENILDEYDFIDGFVQISCPRLSIDWGACYKKPLLSPFELFYNKEYSMDYYASEGGQPWKNYKDGKYNL